MFRVLASIGLLALATGVLSACSTTPTAATFEVRDMAPSQVSVGGPATDSLLIVRDEPGRPDCGLRSVDTSCVLAVGGERLR